jgi:hypothetical protein
MHVLRRVGMLISLRLLCTQLHPAHTCDLHVLAVYPDAGPGDADDWVVIEEGGRFCCSVENCAGNRGDGLRSYDNNCKNIHDNLNNNL